MKQHNERQCRRIERFKALAGAGLAMLALLVILMPGMARAQEGVSADILGTVTDQSGAVIQGAQISVKNVGTGISSNTKSDSKGEYLVQYLQIGTYLVTVDAKGTGAFSATVITNPRMAHKPVVIIDRR